MTSPLILASGSAIRAQLLSVAGVSFTVEVPRVDEDTIKQSLQSEGASPRDVADALAEMKARKISDKFPDTLVLGCDQVLAAKDGLLSKPKDKAEARAHLQHLSGTTHKLISAAVIYENGEPLWRSVGEVRLTMRVIGDTYLDGYIDRNWDSIRHSVGAYKLEEEGVRLFSSIQGDYFTVLGLPLLQILSYLTLRGTIEG
jgi:septum formation protein